MVVLPEGLDQVPTMKFAPEKDLLTQLETWAHANGWIVSDGSNLPLELRQRTDVLLDQPNHDRRIRLAVLRKSRNGVGVIRVDSSNLRTVELLYQRQQPHWRVEAGGVRVEDDLLNRRWADQTDVPIMSRAHSAASGAGTALCPDRTRRSMRFMLVLATCFTLCPFALGLHAESKHGESWDSKAAAVYLDQRTTSWMRNMGAMDHGTFCVSCHTGLPYALARSALRARLGEQSLSPVERQLLDSVTRRVRLWTQVQPYLNNKDQGPGTEAVINALVLVAYDAPNRTLNADTRQALSTMWTMQLKSGEQAGAWPWFSLGNEPWEAPDSQYWGATLAAVAVGTLPQKYRSAPEIQGNLQLLKEYLQHGQHEQSLLNRLTLVWAATKLPGLLNADQKASIVDEVLARQHPDGGWSASDLVVSTWRRGDGTPQETKSDGYATGLAAFAIEQSGIPRTRHATDAARSWLIQNQNRAAGFWPAYSLNKKRDPTSDVGRFMSDAATAFSVLALTSGN